MRILLRLILVMSFAVALVVPDLRNAKAADSEGQDIPCSGVMVAGECVDAPITRQAPSCPERPCVLNGAGGLDLLGKANAARAITAMARASPSPVYTIDRPPKPASL